MNPLKPLNCTSYMCELLGIQYVHYISIKLIQKDLIRSLRRSRKGLKEKAAKGNGKQPRTRLAEKLNASRGHGITGQKI